MKINKIKSHKYEQNYWKSNDTTTNKISDINIIFDHHPSFQEKQANVQQNKDSRIKKIKKTSTHKIIKENQEYQENQDNQEHKERPSMKSRKSRTSTK